MGYDMHWKQKDASEVAAVEAARKEFDAAVAERNELPKEEAGSFNAEKAKETGDWEAHEVYDGRTERFRQAQDRVHAAYEAMGQAEVSYFRLNIFGMSKWRQAMSTLGMAFEAGEVPQYPEPERYGLSGDELDEFLYGDEDNNPAAVSTLNALKRKGAEKWTAERDRVLAWHGPDTPGIPLHKFGSNDGWLVLPAECQAALEVYQGQLEKLGEEGLHAMLDALEINRGYWGQWVAYLNGAISHGGFEVN